MADGAKPVSGLPLRWWSKNPTVIARSTLSTSRSMGPSTRDIIERLFVSVKLRCGAADDDAAPATGEEAVFDAL